MPCAAAALPEQDLSPEPHCPHIEVGLLPGAEACLCRGHSLLQEGGGLHQKDIPARGSDLTGVASGGTLNNLRAVQYGVPPCLWGWTTLPMLD